MSASSTVVALISSQQSCEQRSKQLDSQIFCQTKPDNEKNILIALDGSGSMVSTISMGDEDISIRCGDISIRGGDKLIDDVPKIICFKSAFLDCWNSDNPENNAIKHFKGGVLSIPFPITPANFRQVISTVIKEKITNKCLTYPHLGLKASYSRLLKSATLPDTVVLICDGQIGYGQIPAEELKELELKLVEVIKEIKKSFPTVELEIRTIENRVVDFEQSESMSGAAGCDIWKILQKHQITGLISKFVSFTPNNRAGFVHVMNLIVPPNCLPFQDRFFPQHQMRLFIQYVRVYIGENSKEESKLIRLIQDLSVTLSKAIQNKTPCEKNSLIQIFCRMFEHTVIDSAIATFMLNEAIENDSLGTSQLFAGYRDRMKNLYKQVADLLPKSVSRITGVGNKFMVLPLSGNGSDSVCVIGTSPPTGRFDKLRIGSDTFESAAYRIDCKLVPIFPFATNLLCGGVGEQSIRQWTRKQLAVSEQIPEFGDTAMFIPMMYCLRLCCSGVEQIVIEHFQQLARVMLNKKRAKSEQTEYDFLLSGSIPVGSDGKIETFQKSMLQIAQKLGIQTRPFTVWYLLCGAMGDLELTSSQYWRPPAGAVDPKDIVIQELLRDFEDFPKEATHKAQWEFVVEKFKHQIPKISIRELSTEYLYECLITKADTTLTGGYVINPHKTDDSQHCQPMCVLSEEGMSELLKQLPICPYCYISLDKSNFTKIEPAPQMIQQQIYSADMMMFQQVQPAQPMAQPMAQPVAQPMAQPMAQLAKQNRNLNRTGTLICLKGIPGCGKSTETKKILQWCEQNSIVAVVVGMDEWSQKGYDFFRAQPLIIQRVMRLNECPPDKQIWVIVDTCGERFSIKDVFGIDFTGWKVKYHMPNFLNKQHLKLYMRWATRNVFVRPVFTPDGDHYLNPKDSGIDICVEVGQKKAEKLFGKKIPAIFDSHPRTVEEAVNFLQADATAYQKLLDEAPANESWKF
jgi:hypothetical protein